MRYVNFGLKFNRNYKEIRFINSISIDFCGFHKSITVSIETSAHLTISMRNSLVLISIKVGIWRKFISLM